MADQGNIRKRRKAAAVMTSILVVLNLFAFNVLSENHHARWDLTEDRKYTLSPDTKRILKGIDDLITIKYFVSRDLPSGWAAIREATEDLLEEFRIAGGDHLQVVFLNPSDDSDLRTEAEQYGIPELPLQERGSEKIEALKAYIGIVVLYEDRFEAMPLVRFVSVLEYELLMRIVRLMEKNPPVVAFSQGGSTLPPNLPPELRAQMEARNPYKDRHDVSGDYSQVYAELKKQYDVETVDLEEPVPDYVRTLVVGNSEKLEGAALYHLDQFIMRGGKLFLLIPGVTVDMQRMHGIPRSDKMDDWLAHYGIRVDKNLVLDYPQCATVMTSRDMGRGFRVPVPQPFPPFPRATEETIDQESPVTRGIRDLILPFCSSIHLDSSEGAAARILVRSSPQAWQQEKYFILNIDRPRPPPEDARQQFDLAGIVEGEFISYYAVRPVPEAVRPVPEAVLPKTEQEDPGRDDGPDAGQRDEEEAAPEPREDAPYRPPDLRIRSPRTAILVVGSSDLIADGRFQNYQKIFFINGIDYLTVAEGFGNIRTRQTSERRIDSKYRDDLGAVRLFKMTGTLGAAFLIVLFVLILSLLRKAARKKEVVL